ncbi:MAG: hypothetical protein QM813_00920 [Verrucomicrobiota bacterium]
MELVASGLVNGNVSYFTVAAVNESGESANAAPVRVQPVAGAAPQLTATVSGSRLELSWPQSHTGWLLQAQTNSNGIGIGSNWITSSESSDTNRIIRIVDPAQESVFFRLMHP